MTSQLQNMFFSN